MPHEPLELRAHRDAWDVFQGTGSAEGLRPVIADSWDRSREGFVDPAELVDNAVDVSDETYLARVAWTTLGPLAPLLLGDSASLAVSDARGVVLWQALSDPQLARELDKFGIAPNHTFDESLVGTNGLGLALQTQRPAMVVGRDHFKEPWHRWACAATPIHHPITRNVIGGLNLACRVEDTSRSLVVSLNAALTYLRLAMWESSAGRERRLVEAHSRLRARTGRSTIALNRRMLLLDDTADGVTKSQRELWAALSGPQSVAAIDVGGGMRAAVFRVSDDLEDGFVLVIKPPAADEPVSQETSRSRWNPLELAEREVIEKTLRAHGWNRSYAASTLGISRGTLHSRILRYAIEPPLGHEAR